MSTFLKWKILIGNTCTGNATFPHHSQVWKWWWWEGQEMIWISFSGLSIRVSVSLLIRHQQTQSQQLKINITNQHSHSWMKTLKIKKIICWARHTLTLKWSQYLQLIYALPPLYIRLWGEGGATRYRKSEFYKMLSLLYPVLYLLWTLPSSSNNSQYQ